MKKMVWGLLLASGVVVACELVAAVSGKVVEVSPWDSTSEQWEDIRDSLVGEFGTSLDNKEVISLRVPVKTCLFFICGVSIETQFMKPCNEKLEDTLNEMIEDIRENELIADGGGGDLGDPGGLPDFGGGNDDPFAMCFVSPGGRGCVSVGDGPRQCETFPSELVCPMG
jgi:hypothetical protein